jgi:peptide/nickel transport system permease protein
MRVNEVKTSLLNFWRQFRQVKSGVVGLVLLLLFVVLVVIEPLITAFPDAGTRWRDITYWEDNPTSVEPAWVNWFSSKKSPTSGVLTEPVTTEEKAGSMTIKTATFDYSFKGFAAAPSDLILHCPMRGAVTYVVSFVRPDGKSLELAKKTIRSSGASGARISLGMDGKEAAYVFGVAADPSNASTARKATLNAMDLLFAEAAPGMLSKPKPLSGVYQIKVTALLPSSSDWIETPRLVVAGRVFGVLGTDDSKRDLWSGIVAGTKYALIIGLLTSFISVAVGVVYGVVCAYFGGWVDSLLSRIFEVFLNVPLLPLLIVMSAIFKPSLWFLIFIMAIFFWVGPVKTVRSMALQIKEETYIEAARGLGASHRRLIFKHIVPQLIPYAFATMAISVPGAIVFESSISLIGLGDPTVVTWGQILRDASSGGAVLAGLWWWVVPPGLAIAFMGMTFAFIGFAMDSILNPKLKTR